MSLSFTYNEVSSATYIDLIRNVKKSLTPASIIKEISIPRKDGIHFFDRTFDKRIIRIETLVKGTSISNLLDKIDNLNEFLYKSEPKKLIFSDENDKYFNALFANKTQVINRRIWHANIDLEFHCFDPFAYAVSGSEVNKTDITTKGYTWNVSNTGQYYAYPIITITFNQNQTHIYIQNNSVTGSRFDISKSFSNGNILVVNNKTMGVTLDGVYSPAGFGDGGDSKAEFILLRVGNNQFEVSTTDATLNVDIKTNFNKTYL